MRQNSKSVSTRLLFITRQQLTRDIDVGFLSVRLFVQCWYSVETVVHIVKVFFLVWHRPYSRFHEPKRRYKIRRLTLSTGRLMQRIGQIYVFNRNAVYRGKWAR